METTPPIDTAGLKALAHPLRLRMLGLLRAQGPATATELAARIGTTSGTTSWHLRRLAAAGLVADAPTESGRERRWRAAHASTNVGHADPAVDPERAEATDAVLRAIVQTHTRAAHTWLDTWETSPQEWVRASELSDYLIRLTPAGLTALVTELHEVVQRHRDEVRAAAAAGAGDPAARPVSVVLWAIPRPDLDAAAGSTP